MQEVWDRSPRDFQQVANPRLLMMRCPPYRPEALLLVQGTGGGKSAVVQTVGCVDCGVTIIIEETLALAADQKSKVGRARNSYGPVLAYQLDSVKKPHLIQKLSSKLASLTKTTNITIFLYTSPECLLREPWKSLVVGLINRQVLKLVCVDEVHLFVMFGVTFRKEFTLLKSTFFKYLIDDSGTNNLNSNGSLPLASYLKVPLLLMTATLNADLLRMLQKMIGIRVAPQNYLWSNRDKMARRNIRINVVFTIQRLKTIKTILKETLVGNLDRKCIVYTNTASCLDLMQSEIELWLDMNDEIKGDVLVINGELKPEVKFASAERFTQVIDNQEELINNNRFYPRILLATAGSIGAGLDSSDVYVVCRAGFPTSIFEMAQELGRCGRGRTNESGIVTDNFHLMLSLDDFIYLNTRLFLPPPIVPSIIKPILAAHEEITIQQKNLLDLLKLIVLKGQCWHVELETLLGNITEPPATNVVYCKNACPVCNGTLKDFIMPVKRVGLSNFLADTFINNPSGVITPIVLIKKLLNYPDVGKVVYNRSRSVKCPATKYVNLTILQLIASGLVKMEIDNERNCVLRLVINNLSPSYLDDTIWESLYVVDDCGEEGDDLNINEMT